MCSSLTSTINPELRDKKANLTVFTDLHKSSPGPLFVSLKSSRKSGDVEQKKERPREKNKEKSDR